MRSFKPSSIGLAFKAVFFASDKIRLLTLFLPAAVILVSFPALAADAPQKEAVSAEAESVNPPAVSASDAVPDYKNASSDAALFSVARALARKRDFKEAVAAYQRLIESFPSSPLKLKAYYEAGCLHWRLGDVKDAKAVLAGIAGSEADGAMKTRAAALVAEIDGAIYRATHEDGAPAIGVVLALKGDYAPYGEAALRGILLGSGIFNPPAADVEAKGDANGQGAALTVYVKDAGDEPDRAQAAVKELSSNARVFGIVGPLLSANALSAAHAAEKEGIPIITLSQREGVTPGGGWAFRNSLTPEGQTSAIAAYAVGTLKLKRFAIIYPQNNYGDRMAGLFKKEVQRLGASVAAMAPYEDGTMDFSAMLKQAFKVAVKKKKEGRRTIKEYSPGVQADAVFIPDYYETVGLLLPYLEYLNIKDVQLLGANGWNSGRLAAAAGRAVEGAVFVDGFFAGSLRPGAAEFTANFEKTYSAEPGVIEAGAYDAALAFKSLATVNKTGEAKTPDRSGVKDGLKSLRGVRGVAGELSFDAGGEAVKKPFLLTVKNGRITEVGQ